LRIHQTRVIILHLHILHLEGTQCTAVRGKSSLVGCHIATDDAARSAVVSP